MHITDLEERKRIFRSVPLGFCEMLGDEDDGSKKPEKKVYTRKKSFKEVNNSISSSNVSREQQLRDQAMVYEGINQSKSSFLRQENRVRINLSMKSTHEVMELRKKLECERDMVRSLMKKIEANETLKPLKQLSVSVLENSKNGGDNMDKEKRTPKVNKYYRNADFLLAKDKFPLTESNKKLKSNGKKARGDELGKFPNRVFKSCQVLLEKLMKHKHAWVFNKPVDAVGLGLHDYFEVIKNPMDLGTVKNRLSQNWYNTPLEFADDVRLTLKNAMMYNPKEQDVYVMAELLSKLFEEKWTRVEADFSRKLKHVVDVGPTSRKNPQQLLEQHVMRNVVDRANLKSNYVDPKGTSINIALSGRSPAPKKPKAKDPNKRGMTYDEKQKLSMNLQSLPSEKLESVVLIIKKRNPSLTQQDDEIEVDIDIVDTETLWELDRFITYYKKNLSKNKRKVEIFTQLTAGPEEMTQDKIPTLIVTESSKGSADKEKVVSSPVQVEGEGGNDTNQGGNQSSSDGETGSSSSDSDGESSSGDESDGGHSPKDDLKFTTDVF